MLVERETSCLATQNLEEIFKKFFLEEYQIGTIFGDENIVTNKY